VPDEGTIAHSMGCASSTDSSGPGNAGKRPLDPGLEKEFEYVKLLGKGGTGETHLYRERKSGRLVAIKLVPRPLPRVLHESILREITVCLSCARTTRPHVLRLLMLPRGSTCKLERCKAAAGEAQGCAHAVVSRLAAVLSPKQQDKVAPHPDSSQLIPCCI